MLAKEFSISRTPIREALSRLAEEGLLERARGGGFVVRSFAIADVLDMIELRGVLEGTAARLAAERGVSAAKLAGIPPPRPSTTPSSRRSPRSAASRTARANVVQLFAAGEGGDGQLPGLGLVIN